MQQDELTLDLADISTADTMKGLRLNMNKVEKLDLMQALSRKNLEAFVERLTNWQPLPGGVISFPARISFSVGVDSFVRELVMVEIRLKNNTGHICLRNARKLQCYDYPASYDTRSEMVRTASGQLFILGHSQKEGDFALWITHLKSAA